MTYQVGGDLGTETVAPSHGRVQFENTMSTYGMYADQL